MATIKFDRQTFMFDEVWCGHIDEDLVCTARTFADCESQVNYILAQRNEREKKVEDEQVALKNYKDNGPIIKVV